MDEEFDLLSESLPQASEQPFVVERANSPGKLDGRVRLNAEAKHWAQEHGLTLAELAKYLLQRDLDRKAGRID
jgi:hypothetical protein